MSEFALILGAVALVCIVGAIFLGGSIRDLFGGTGSRLQQPGPFTPPSVPSGLSYPATLVDCQDPGWRNYAQFANESECTEYVDGLTP